MDTDNADLHELRSFGRRRARKKSQRQEMLFRDILPKIGIDLANPAALPLESIFPVLVRETRLEIGFGGAEHLIWQARQAPDVGFIGCEPFEDGIAKALSEIEQGGLQNIRIFPDDARKLLRWLPEASIARAYILFPDPWPKARHKKRRLVGPALLQQLARVMRPGAELMLATDIGDYARTMLMALRDNPGFAWTATSPNDWRLRPADWPQTRYEQKALTNGRRPVYLTFTRQPTLK